MIKIDKNKSFIIKETINKIDNSDELALYVLLLSYQEEKIYFETIKEISKTFKKAYKTTQKYLRELIKHNLVIKYKGVYIVNYFQQERLK